MNIEKIIKISKEKEISNLAATKYVIVEDKNLQVQKEFEGTYEGISEAFAEWKAENKDEWKKEWKKIKKALKEAV